METIVVHIKNKKDSKFIKELLTRLGIDFFSIQGKPKQDFSDTKINRKRI